MVFELDTSALLAIGLFTLSLLIKNTVDTARLKARVDGLCSRISELRATVDTAAFRR